MSLVTIRTPDGLDAVLEEGHWTTHITTRHPEMLPYEELVIETLKNPNCVYRGRRDRTTRIYTRSYSQILIGGRTIEKANLRVFVREANGFVATAYFSVAELSGLGEKIWPL